jgi:hypothetical protein
VTCDRGELLNIGQPKMVFVEKMGLTDIIRWLSVSTCAKEVKIVVKRLVLWSNSLFKQLVTLDLLNIGLHHLGQAPILDRTCDV